METMTRLLVLVLATVLYLAPLMLILWVTIRLLNRQHLHRATVMHQIRRSLPSQVQPALPHVPGVQKRLRSGLLFPRKFSKK